MAEKGSRRPSKERWGGSRMNRQRKARKKEKIDKGQMKDRRDF